MSRKGNCWDNTAAESFFHTLKTKLTHHEDFQARGGVQQVIFEYIEVFYNRQKKHSINCYLVSFKYEQLLAEVAQSKKCPESSCYLKQFVILKRSLKLNYCKRNNKQFLNATCIKQTRVDDVCSACRKLLSINSVLIGELVLSKSLFQFKGREIVSHLHAQ